MIDRLRRVPWAALAAAVVLNAALAFENWWPTPAIVPLAQLAPEFLGLWLLLLVAAIGGVATRPRLISLVAACYMALVIGRYADVTSPALYGRPLSWHWDGKHLPDLIAGAIAQSAPWRVAAIVLGIAVGIVAGHRLLRWLIALLARAARPASRSALAWSTTALATAVVVAYLAGVQATWSWVSPPVLRGWWQQAALVWAARSPENLDEVLPPSPAFDSDLGAVADADVVLIFLESYGASTIDDAVLAHDLEPGRRKLGEAIARSGNTVVSAQIRSPTFAGGSWLTHAALLTGIDTADPARYPLLLASDRDNLVKRFRARGHRTIGLMPGMRGSWPEGSFYDYEQLITASELDYRGPRFGFWQIPDQYSIARLEALSSAEAEVDGRPRFIVFPTITSHIPFDPVPPLQPDWTRLLGPTPFDPAEVARVLARSPDWLALRDPYLRSLVYSFGWIGDWLERPTERERVVLIVGDHQPAAQVTGRDASWNVPVHLITSNAQLLDRIQRAGFAPGLAPPSPAIGDMPWLLRVLLDVFDSHAPVPAPGGHP